MSKVTSTATLASSRSRYSGSTLTFSESERTQVLTHLEDIFASTVFRNSRRYCALLRYVVERSLDGQADLLKERTIGVEAFGRPTDYDTNVDHCVRSAAGEVRRRLAQYYMETGESGVRIELLPGSYVPQFRFIERAPECVEPALVVPIAPGPVALEPEAPPEIKRRRFAWPAVAACAVVGLALVVAAIWRSPTPFDKLWKPILASQNPVLICVGGGQDSSADAAAQPIVTFADLDRSASRRMNVSDALALVAVTSSLRAQGKPYRILKRAGATSFQDLQQGPFVLIGAMNNEWSLRLTSNLRFNFVRTDSGVYIADKQNPKNTSWFFTFGGAVAQPARDYAIVTRLHDQLTEQSGLIVAGIGSWATQAAGEFVSNPDHARKLQTFAPRDWEEKNFQVVIGTDIIRGSSGPPTVLAAYFW